MFVALEKVEELLLVGGAIACFDDSLELLDFVVVELLLVLEEPLTLVGKVGCLSHVIDILRLLSLQLGIELLFFSETGSSYLKWPK